MMMRFTRAILLTTFIAFACVRAAETDPEVKAHEAALDLAGAFNNEGFKTRDGHWSGTISPGQKQIIAVNLFAGNQYWFVAGGANDAEKISIEMFDENGKPVAVDPYDSDNRTAAGFSPTSSGQYFVALVTAGKQPAAICLIYSYK